jgi:predicted nucleic acid-binding protein
MGNLDMMISSRARASDLTLVASDKVFGRVKGLSLDEWTR